ERRVLVETFLEGVVEQIHDVIVPPGGQNVRIVSGDWRRADWIALAGVTAAAASIRIARLSLPRGEVYDEAYYERDACRYVRLPSGCRPRIPEPAREVHPPLGKWIISAGIKAFGSTTFGWRIGAAVAGTVTVALLYLLARKLFASTLAATVTAGT